MKSTTRFNLMSIYLILSFHFFSSSTLLAKKVDLNSAKQVALNLFFDKSYMSKNMIEIKETIPVYYKDELVFRIFNFSPKGFVIVSAEDNTIPILGYGTDINFSFEEIPPGLNCLLDEFKKEIAYAKKNEIKPSKEISEKWNTLSSSEFIRLKSYTPGTHLIHTGANEIALMINAPMTRYIQVSIVMLVVMLLLWGNYCINGDVLFIPMVPVHIHRLILLIH